MLFQDSLRREKKIKQKQQFVHFRTSSFVIVETCADRVQNYPGALEYFYGRARSVVLPFWNDLLLPGVYSSILSRIHSKPETEEKAQNVEQTSFALLEKKLLL